MKSNPDKFQFIILGNKGPHTLQIKDITTLLGIAIDLKWNIRGHIDKIKQPLRPKNSTTSMTLEDLQNF